MMMQIKMIILKKFHHPFLRRSLAFVALICGLTNPALALELLRGDAIQGGMMVLKVAPSSGVTINGAPAMVSPEGIAVTSFQRDDTDAITIIETQGGAEIDRMVITPSTRTYLEQRINGLPSNMVTPPEEVLNRIKRDRKIVMDAREHASPLIAFSQPFSWPTKGIITGVYGSRRILNDEPRAPHYGIDIAAPSGTPVYAPQAGIIRMVEDLYFTGWTIILDHGHGISSTFLHLASTEGAVGDQLEKGALIGTVGSTGRSTGPHLDWRINHFQKRLDPALLVGPMPK